MEQEKPRYDLRLLKIVEPVRSVDPQLPELKEGSIVPWFDRQKGTAYESHRPLVDMTIKGKDAPTMAVHYTLPDISVDDEYIS